MTDNRYLVGIFPSEFNHILQTNIPLLNIYYSSGLEKHLQKRRHTECLPYISRLSEIIANPDYIGVNQNEKGVSFELVKKLDFSLLVGIKLDVEGDYLYVSTMHEIQQSKCERRLHSGRLKPLK